MKTNGIIYELRCCIDGEWHPFYVGHTDNPKSRMSGHRSSVKKGQTLVYQFIREKLVPANIPWDMFEVERYDHYDNQEDEHIMALLYDGVRLKNMKKGDSKWMERKLIEAEDMRKRGIRSYKQYREQLTLEEQERIAAEKHSKWVLEQEALKKQSQMARILAEMAVETQRKREIKAQEDAKKYEAQLRRERELEIIRQEQRRVWEEANKERLAEEARLRAIEEARIEKQRQEEELAERLLFEQQQQELDNKVNYIAVKAGLKPIVRKENTLDFGDLFE